VSFPLFRRPGTIVVVDDDEQYVEMLRVVLPADWNLLLFTAPQPVIPLVQENAKLCDADATKQQSIAMSGLERPVVPELLKYLEATPERFGIINVIVSDEAMPAMRGLKMFSKIGPWGGARILLTGVADEHIAIDALNAKPNRLIEQYVPKHGRAGMSRALTETILELSRESHPRYTQIWRGLLSSEYNDMLQDAQVGADLQRFVDQHWVEYFVVGQPFGILGVSKAGRPSWLKLEPTESLADAATIASDAGCTPDEVQAVREGKALAVEHIGGGVKQRVAPAFELGKGKLLAAHFEPWPAFANGGYARWHAEQPGRELA